jgi:predicted dehydrogenase
MERQIEDFLNALEENREPLITGEDGRRTVELFTAIYRSTRENAPVKFPL